MGVLAMLMTFTIELEDSDGNDGVFEIEAGSPREAMRKAVAQHDRECGHGAHIWVVSCEEND